MYYLFSPMLDEKGERVVRKLREFEWGEIVGCDPELEGPRCQYDHEHLELFDKPLPILTLQKFEEDPLKEIRTIYNRYQDILDPGGYPMCAESMWQAIAAVMERLEGK